MEAYNNPAVPSEVVDKLNSLDIETLTPIEVAELPLRAEKDPERQLEWLIY